jgi:chemotaxis protein MotB
MAARPADDPPPAGAPEWVVTFGDMMSLLLTFFVLLLSFSTMEAQQFKMIAGYMREAFGLQTKENYTGVPMGTTILSTDARQSTRADDDMSLVKAIRKEMERAGMTEHASVQVTERGVAVRLDGEVLFGSGRSRLKSEAMPLLDQIGQLAAAGEGSIEVEGHTDNVPISSSLYPSNWELSSARAGAAARYLIGRGVAPSKIKAIGLADTRPIAPNDTADNRAQNRRVEFIFVRGGPDSVPPRELPVQSAAEQLQPIVIPPAVSLNTEALAVQEIKDNGGRDQTGEAGTGRREPASEEE